MGEKKQRKGRRQEGKRAQKGFVSWVVKLKQIQDSESYEPNSCSLSLQHKTLCNFKYSIKEEQRHTIKLW